MGERKRERQRGRERDRETEREREKERGRERGREGDNFFLLSFYLTCIAFLAFPRITYKKERYQNMALEIYTYI